MKSVTPSYSRSRSFTEQEVLQPVVVQGPALAAPFGLDRGIFQCPEPDAPSLYYHYLDLLLSMPIDPPPTASSGTRSPSPEKADLSYCGIRASSPAQRAEKKDRASGISCVPIARGMLDSCACPPKAGEVARSPPLPILFSPDYSFGSHLPGSPRTWTSALAGCAAARASWSS